MYVVKAVLSLLSRTSDLSNATVPAPFLFSRFWILLVVLWIELGALCRCPPLSKLYL